MQLKMQNALRSFLTPYLSFEFPEIRSQLNEQLRCLETRTEAQVGHIICSFFCIITMFFKCYFFFLENLAL